MSDLPSALGIEAVELVSEGGRSVTVRVTGRWRRRRPELRGQAMLVVETETGRQRFPAMPEPPSLIGAAPGTWRMSFTVPAELAPELPGGTFLQLGAVMVRLPVGEVPSPGEDAPDGPPPDLLEARQLRSTELAAESARRRAAEAESAVARLRARLGQIEDELAGARAEADRLRGVISERERDLRGTRQHVHAERALRIEVEQKLTEKSRAAAHELRVLHEHVADLERDLTRMRRSIDEAEHLAAAAEAARADAEHRLAERPPPAPPATAPPEPAPEVDRVRARLIAAEFDCAHAAPASRAEPPPAPGLGPAWPADQAALRMEAAMAERRSASLEGELADARRDLGEAHADLEKAHADLEEAHTDLKQAHGTLDGVCRDLGEARRELEEQRRRNLRAYEAIAFVRRELEQIRATVLEPPAPAPAPTPSASVPGPIQAEKLSAALARLREGAVPASEPPVPQAPAPEATAPEATAPGAPAPGATAPGATASGATAPERPSPAAPKPERPARPWLARAFRTLAARDPSEAGRLLLALLPAQRAADPHPVVYDLVVGDLICAHVTVDSLTVRVELDATARPASEVDFQLVGDLASIARLLAAGPLRRRFGWLPVGGRLARVRGDRHRLPALEHLIDSALTVDRLYAAGVRLDPVLAMTMAGLMIEPAWTAGERFSVAHQEPGAATPDAYLHVRDGRPSLASAEPSHGPVATTIECPADDLIGVLAGDQVASVAISGDGRPVALIRQWLDRAQCG